MSEKQQDKPESLKRPVGRPKFKGKMEELAELKEESAANEKRLNAQIELLTLKLAEKQQAVAPVVIRKATETQEYTVGQDNPRGMRSSGPRAGALDPALIEPVDQPVQREKMEQLLFMEDELTVLIHDSSNDSDTPIPEIINAGVRQFFIRNHEQKVKRKFVEILSRCKKTIYSQELRKDAAGNDTYVHIPHTTLTYPFSVLHDPNKRGKDWLKAILAEA